MKRFVEGVDRDQSSMFAERLDDWIGEDNPVRVVDVFVDELDLGGLGFDRVEPQAADQSARAVVIDKTGNPVSTDHPDPKTRYTENTASVSTRPGSTAEV